VYISVSYVTLYMCTFRLATLHFMCTFWLATLYFTYAHSGTWCVYFTIAVATDSLLPKTCSELISLQFYMLCVFCSLFSNRRHRVEGNLHRRTENQCPTGGLPEGEGLGCGGVCHSSLRQGGKLLYQVCAANHV